MLSIPLAQKLKNAGLTWTPGPRDFFAVPDRGMDDQVFVLNYMMVGTGMVHGEPVVTFYGTTEMPIDYLPLTEAVWLPSETQLRTLLEERLIRHGETGLHLTSTTHGYRCQVQFRGETVVFDGFSVDEAYGLALLHVMKDQQAQ
jgi:hypothetical protein